jgi:putative ABC transport system substrate-binding protein
MVPLPKQSFGIRLVFILACLLFAGAAAASDSRTLRVGLIGFAPVELRQGYEQSPVKGLEDLGYVEGKNLELVRRYADGKPARAEQIAQELTSLDLDAIVTTCAPTTEVMEKTTQTTPLVMAAATDPVGAGLIKSYARPGGNVTGLATQFEDIVGKMLQLFTEAVPDDLPLALPTGFELAVNLGTAKALGITIPQSVMVRADRVIQ